MLSRQRLVADKQSCTVPTRFSELNTFVSASIFFLFIYLENSLTRPPILLANFSA